MKVASFLFCLVLFVFSCKSKKTNNNLNGFPSIDLTTEIKMKVIEIDSLDNYYVIYGMDANKYRYKVVSEKREANTCVKIKKNSSYVFKVRELLSNKRPVNNNEEFPTPVNYLDLKRCVTLKNNTEVCTEPSIVNIHECSNLRGLCLAEK